MTLAVGSGFQPKQLLPIIQQTFCYQTLDETQWQWMINFLVQGSQSLEQYDEYKKVNVLEDGRIKVLNRGIAMRHRLSMGTIVSDADLKCATKGLSGYCGRVVCGQAQTGGCVYFFRTKFRTHPHAQHGSHRKEVQIGESKNPRLDGAHEL